MSWSPLHAQFHQVLRSRRLVKKRQRILVAVSGGQDSLCLIRLLLDLQPKWDWQVAIAHCNHRWRSDAEANAAYVEELAHTWGVPCHGLVIAAADQTSIASEAGARQWRYQVLTETAIAHNYAVVMTGHTASDRAETLLYNLMRGSGTDGLQSLTWKRSLALHLHDNPTHQTPIQLIRPLLFMTRSQTGQFCHEAQLQPWLDRTNDDWTYARNRIRQDVLPYLQEHFNPNVEQNLARTAEILQADVAYLEAEVDKLWQQVAECSPAKVTHQFSSPESHPPQSPLDQGGSPGPPPLLSQSVSEGRRGVRGGNSTTSMCSADTHQPQPPAAVTFKLNRKILATAPLALQRRVIRRCLLNLLPKAPSFDHIEKLTGLITAPNRSQTDPFPGGAIAHVQGDWIIIQ